MADRRNNMPRSLRDAAEKAIQFNGDKIARMEREIEHLNGELVRARHENHINLKASKSGFVLAPEKHNVWEGMRLYKTILEKT